MQTTFRGWPRQTLEDQPPEPCWSSCPANGGDNEKGQDFLLFPKPQSHSGSHDDDFAQHKGSDYQNHQHHDD
jgi:hypothetical protein